ncbi:MAG: GEVED domain-containing protein [Flavisolibacter sp.]
MKKLLLLLSISCVLLPAAFTYAQCPGGYTQAVLNWDYLDYFPFSGNYSTGFLASNAWTQTQRFQFGTQRVTITHNFADAASLGENGTHTGETGSYGTGDDISFNGNGTITFTFDNDVQNLKFSIYDLDNSQNATVTAKNAANVAQNVTLTKANAAALQVITGSGTTSASVTSLVVGAVANTSNTGTINVDVAGPVNSVTIAFGGTAGDFWISDVTACTAGDFPNSYFNVSRPFTGQPGYILHALDKSVYAVNPVNGFTKLLFTDPDVSLGNSQFINSMGYDPYKRILYYVYSLTATPGNNKKLMKYDFNTGTISTVLNDITTIGVPVTSFSGVESGAAAFYNGSLYLGVEATNSGKNAGRESVIWRIDFDASNNPYRACQAWATPSDNGSGLLLHDWADFSMNDGMLYDFDGAGANTGSLETDTYNYDMMTGAVTNWHLPAWIPGQPAVDWNGQVYNLHAITSAPAITPYVATYNPATGLLGTHFNITSNPMYTPANPSLGDAAEAFRPLCDFGDAPASYDPVALSPAVHEIDPKLHLGNSEDIEWISRGQSAPATSDNFDDALPFITAFSPYSAAYLIQAKVFNNTGANATVAAWLDYNGNGVFDASEGITVTVPTNAAAQNIYLYWPLISSPLSTGTFTYLRIRVTSASNGMTTSGATGYFANGEVEDYRVPVNNYVLATQLLSFSAQKNNAKHVDLQWHTSSEQGGTKYELQRSTDMIHWTDLHETVGMGGSGNYSYTDASPLNGTSYYRLKTMNADGSVSFSKIENIMLESIFSYTLSPNPTPGEVKLTITSDEKKTAYVKMSDIMGRVVYQQTLTIEPGTKTLILPVTNLTNGMYSIQLQVDSKMYNEKLIIKK